MTPTQAQEILQDKSDSTIIMEGVAEEEKVKTLVNCMYGLAIELWEIIQRHPLEDCPLYSQARQLALQSISIRLNHLRKESRNV
jgi:hypothetical protein